MERSRRRAKPAQGIFASRELTAPGFGFLRRRRDIHGGGAAAGGRLVDPVASWTSWRWKIEALRIVGANGHHAPIPADDLVKDLTRWRDEMVGAERLEEISVALWRMETLASRFFELGGAGLRLDDERIPLEARPIAHSGLGLAAAMHAGFDPRAILSYIRERGADDYLFFAYESAGAMLAAFQDDLFGRTFHLLGRMKRTVPLPDHRHREDVFERLRDNRALLLGHGYGRLLYLKKHSLASAVKAARRTSYLPFDALVRGIAAAYVMVNSAALPKALRLAESAARLPEVSEPIRDGLINVMAFFEWMAPGCLGHLEPPGTGAAALVDVARREAREARYQGLPPPFALGADGER